MLGCCRHIAAFIYYLPFARHFGNEMRKPANYLDSSLVSNKREENSNPIDDSSMGKAPVSSDNISEDSGQDFSITNTVSTQKKSKSIRNNRKLKSSFNLNVPSILWLK